MTARKRILALLLMAICLLGILPLSVGATDVFSLGDTYQFTPPGYVSSSYEAHGSFLGDLYFEGQDKLNDLNVVSFDLSIIVWNDIDPSNITYDISFGVICTGFYPTGEQQIPVYYDMLFYQVGQDTINISDTSTYFIVQVATLVDEEVVMIDSYTAHIDKITIIPTGFADETIPANYNYLVSWFTEESVLNNPYLPLADDYIDKMSQLIDVIVSECGKLLTNDNFWSIILIVGASTAIACTLSIFISFFRRY